MKGTKKAGRPAVHDDPSAMEKLINDFFDTLGEKQPTVSGLALHLGFTSKQSLYDYQKKPEFADIILRARLRIESCYEQQLFGKYPTGAIFALKNMGWNDRQQIEMSGKTEFSHLSDEELEQRIAELQEGRD